MDGEREDGVRRSFRARAADRESAARFDAAQRRAAGACGFRCNRPARAPADRGPRRPAGTHRRAVGPEETRVGAELFAPAAANHPAVTEHGVRDAVLKAYLIRTGT